MKYLLLSSIIFSASLALACPGGHLKTLSVNVKGQQDPVPLAEVNMSNDTVKVINANAELISVLWSPKMNSNSDGMMRTICGSNKRCTSDQALGFRLQEFRNSTLLVILSYKGKVQNFDVTNFAQTRSFGGCGETVLPRKP